MNRNILYGLVFVVLFCALILPDTLHPGKGFIFTVEEWAALLLLLVTVLLLRNGVANIVQRLNRHYPWGTSTRKRLLLQAVVILLGTSIMSTVILLPTAYYLQQNGTPAFYQRILDRKEEIRALDHETRDGDDDPPHEWTIVDLMAAVLQVNFFGLLLLFVVEETYGYVNLQSNKKLAFERLQKEQAQLKASALSKQLDPHFMFNTLNVLSGLIYQDVDKSAQFIKELSKVYRYVLERSEELVSTVEQEFRFLDSYLYLLRIRFGDKLPVQMDIPANRKHWLLPSMTLELLVENAIKHNVVDRERPLHLTLEIIDDQLVVKNNLQLRKNVNTSLSLGLNNLKKRLELLGEKDYRFGVEGEEYVAVIPLINPEHV